MRWAWVVVMVLGGCDGCRGCRPDLTQDTDQDQETGDPDTDPVIDTDTGPPPPCDAPELEPNGAIDDATWLPLERDGCGEFSEALDLDFWEFEVEEDSWTGLLVDSRSLGSKAHVNMLMSSELGEEALVGAIRGEEDAHLLFPALADTYTVLLTEQTVQGGGEDYFYEILATRSKAPVEWDRGEGDNDEIESAQLMSSGERVLGWPADRLDHDWYLVEVPAGKHTVTLDVDAWEYDSAGDFKISVYMGESASTAEHELTYFVGEEGWEPDAWGEITSTGDLEYWVQVSEQERRSGRAYWYVFEVTVEASE